MGLAIIANDSCPVNGEDHRQVLEANIMNELIIGSLEKGRVDGHDGNEALSGESCG